jgi:SAM-dependent methyltransferase
MSVETVLRGYDESGAELMRRYEAIDPEQLYAHVADAFPKTPGRVLDIGAGTGRDAAWLVGRGHQVTAVEPAEALRLAGQELHPETAIDWIDDRLPDLPVVRAQGARFDCLLLSGVWQHLSAPDRARAMPVIAGLLAADGHLIMSLRHGPGAANRPCFEAAPEETIANGRAAGLELILRRSAPSIQPENRTVGVVWTWLVFRRAAPNAG